MYIVTCPCCEKQISFDIVGGSVVFDPPSLSTGEDGENLTIVKYEFGVPIPRKEVSDVSG